MALWQFDFHIVPRRKCVIAEDLDNEDILSWKQDEISSIEISFLERKASWTEDIVQYGRVDGTCIEFLYEDKNLEEISCRFDLRSLSKKLLKEILDFVEKIDGMVFYEGKIYAPKLDVVVELMKNSKANNFCQNPIKFFEELSNC